MQRFSIRSLLLLLVLGVTLPLAAVLVYIQSLRLDARTGFAYELARGAAETARGSVENVIHAGRVTLARLARGGCAELPAHREEVLPSRASIAFLDISGALLCGEGAAYAPTIASLREHPAFREMARTGAVASAGFAPSPLTGRWALLLFAPRYDRDGTWVGAVVLELDHAAFGEALRSVHLHERDGIALIAREDAALRVVASSLDPRKYGGQILESRPDLDGVLAGKTDLITGPGVDGRERIGAVQRIQSTGWYVIAGLDRERVMASIYRQQTRVGVAYAAVILTALLIGVWLSARIARPIVALSRAAPSALAEEGGTPLREAGPREVAELARRLGEAIRGHLEAVADLRRLSVQTQAYLRHSPALYIRCDTEGRIGVATERWKALFVEPGTHVEGKELGSFLPPEVASACRRFVEEAVRDRKSVILEHELPTRQGARTFVSTLFPVPDANDVVGAVGVISLDVTDLRTAEMEKERLNIVLRRVTEAVPLCLSYIDADNHYVWTNARNGERLGRPPEWIVGRTAREVYGRQFQEISDGAILVRQGNSVREERAWRGADGELRDYEHVLVPDLDPNEKYRGHTSMWLDITERKAAQEREREYAERLQVLSRRLIDAQEAERRAVARELHDEVGQQLTAVLFMLRSLQGAAVSPEAAARLEDGAALVNATIDGVRDTSLRLRPAILDDLGLVPALRWLVEQQARLTHIDMSLELGDLSSDVPPQTATGCFRIVQEAITNAVRHARSDHIRVRLREAGAGIEVEVEDDGIGFDLDVARKQASDGRSSGLTGMRERAELLGGTCWVQAQPGSGTKIRAALPLAA